MMHTRAAPAGGTALLVAVLFMAQQNAAAGGSTGWMHDVRLFEGTARWQWYRHIWSDKVVTVYCSFKDFHAYVAPTAMELQEAKSMGRTASCGLMHFLKPANAPCKISLSPFQDTYVAIERPPKWSRIQDGGECTLELNDERSVWRPLLGAAGVFLFLNADTLSHSLTFRLFTGAVSFMLVSGLVVAFIVYRQLPHRRLLALLAAVTASFPWLLKHALAAWIPSSTHLTVNEALAVYAAISCLIGMAVTYYYDNPENSKMLHILAFSMRLLGLLMVYVQSPATEISGTLVALLAGYCLTAPLLPSASAGAAKLLSEWDRVHRRASTLLQSVYSLLEGKEAHNGYPARADTERDADIGSDSAEEDVDEAPRTHHYLLRRLEDTPTTPSPSRPSTRSTPRPAEVTPAAPTPTPVQQRNPADHEMSPLVQHGLILNVQTGRNIKIGKGTYNQLMTAGYVEDLVRGTLTPPTRK